MDKQVRYINGDYQLLLGERDGERYWLEQASFDCEWYWGLGYVESYRGCGQSSKSWRSHQHFDGLFLKPAKFVEGYKDFFDDRTLMEDKEIWTLLELMSAAYKCREYSDMLHLGGAHITTNPCKDLLINPDEYARLNNHVIPELMNKVYELLAPNEGSLSLVKHKVGKRYVSDPFYEDDGNDWAD